jgi:hypothetical protein
LERLADEEPAKIAAIAYGILPKEAFVKVENCRSTAEGFAADGR